MNRGDKSDLASPFVSGTSLTCTILHAAPIQGPTGWLSLRWSHTPVPSFQPPATWVVRRCGSEDVRSQEVRGVLGLERGLCGTISLLLATRVRSPRRCPHLETGFARLSIEAAIHEYCHFFARRQLENFLWAGTPEKKGATVKLSWRRSGLRHMLSANH